MKYFIFCVILSYFFLGCGKKEISQKETHDFNNESKKIGVEYADIKKEGFLFHFEKNFQFKNQFRLLYVFDEETKYIVYINPFEKVNTELSIGVGPTEIDIKIIKIDKNNKVRTRNQKVKKVIERCLPFIREAQQSPEEFLKPTE